jgi:hypothetical protein
VVGSGQHQHAGVVALLGQSPADLVAVHRRKVAVEDDHVVAGQVHLAQRIGAVARDVDRHALAAQTARDRGRKLRLVLNDQHAHQPPLPASKSSTSCQDPCFAGITPALPKTTRASSYGGSRTPTSTTREAPVHHRLSERVRPALVTVAAAAALATAGCGGSTSSPSTASPGDQAFIDFTHCMRSHGVNVPDPVHRPGHTGLSLMLPRMTVADRPATNACNHFLAPVIAMKQAGLTSELPALIRYARCMRTHGISMPDPGPQGQLNLGPVPGMVSQYGRYSPQFRAADTACRHLLPAGVHDDGTGP